MIYKLDGKDSETWKIYVPPSIDEDIITAVQKGIGHSGVERVCLTIRECMYIKHLNRKARKLIATCEL